MADRFCVKFSEPGVLMKKNIATAALVVMPNAGHNINLEDPAAFNAHLAELLAAADADLASVAVACASPCARVPWSRLFPDDRPDHRARMRKSLYNH